MRSLEFTPSAKPGHMRLVIRTHDLGGTDYEMIAVWPDSLVRDFIELAAQYNGRIGFVYGEPDWEKRSIEAKIAKLDKERAKLAAKLAEKETTDD